MKLISTAYFPPILQYAWMLQSGEVTVEQWETFPKQTWRNRCDIFTANGVQSLSVPVVKPNGTKTLSRDIRISYDTPWQQLHWKTIKTAYNSSPFLLYYQDELSTVFTKKHTFLLDLNEEIFALINDLMEWTISWERSLDFVFPSQLGEEVDKRFVLSPKQKADFHLPRYIQVFSDQYAFAENLSILDLILNLGPEAESYLMKIGK